MTFDTKNIILIGPPGCGKGTQAKFLKQNNFKIIIAGDLLREISDLDTKFGNHVAEIINNGNLVPSDMINEMIFNKINFIKEMNPLSNNIVMDGYPRKIAQAEYLSIIMDIHKVLFFEVDENILIERLLERGKISNREDDKDESVIRERMKVYHQETYPLKEYYENKGILKIIDGNLSIDKVKEQIDIHLR